ncbi:Putative inositol monophosphatase 3, partial [Eumeta japonica]
SRDLKEKSKGKTDEGANDPFTDADARSLRYETRFAHLSRVSIFSEEDKESCAEANTFDLDPTVLHESAEIPDELVNRKDVTIWIDPLDATQEFTGDVKDLTRTVFGENSNMLTAAGAGYKSAASDCQ